MVTEEQKPAALTAEFLAKLKQELGPPPASLLVVRPDIESAALKMLRERAEALGALRLPQAEELTAATVYGMELYTKPDQKAAIWAFSDKAIAAAYLRGWLTEKALEELSKPLTATEATVLNRDWLLRLLSDVTLDDIRRARDACLRYREEPPSEKSDITY